MSSNEPPAYPGDIGPSDGLPVYGSVPPPPGGYPPPAPGGAGDAYDASDAIGYGWRGFRANAGALIGATVIVAVGAIALYALAERIAPQPELIASDGTFEFRFDGPGLLSSTIAQTVVGGVAYLLSAMLVRGSLDITEGRRFSIGQAFSRIPVAPVILTGLLLSVLSTIGIVLCILPGLVFSIFSFFTLYFVVDRDESPFTALASSFKLVGAHFGQALLTGLLAFLVLMAGTIALLIGLLVAIPVVSVAGAYSYRKFSGQPVTEPA